MADQDPGQDVVQSLTDPIKGAWKAGNDLLNKIPGIGMAKRPESEHDKAVGAMNKAADDETVANANKTFHPTQTAAQKKTAPVQTTGKITIKAAQRKR